MTHITLCIIYTHGCIETHIYKVTHVVHLSLFLSVFPLLFVNQELIGCFFLVYQYHISTFSSVYNQWVAKRLKSNLFKTTETDRCVCALLCFVSFSLLTPRWSSLQQDKLTSNIGHFSETQVWLNEEGI